MNEANINPSGVLEDEQDDEKVTRSNGVRKRLFMNEADINPSIVLEDEQDNEKVIGSNGIKKRLFMNEANINPSIVLEDKVSPFPITKSNRFHLSGTEPIQFDLNSLGTEPILFDLNGPVACATPPPRESQHFIMAENGACVADVHSPGEYVDVVLLDKHSCTCQKWDVLGILCSHALAVIEARGLDPYDFCQHWFSRDTYRQTYSHVLHATRDIRQWEERSNVRVLPPHVRRQPG
ncbi:hypothetical protein MRB53_032854 [Persea americana]|uniref:Uncharacterized protein n=1 Tax=Persea americana TaxID=3435 RepID=A0ACC2KSY5_PERAE|nr:hypothetical protein MRB53_032854 [Persea americana]